MLNLFEADDRYGCKRSTRREALRVGFLGLGGLTLAHLVALRAAASQERKNTSVILLWIAGGPSHRLRKSRYSTDRNGSRQMQSGYRPASSVHRRQTRPMQ